MYSKTIQKMLIYLVLLTIFLNCVETPKENTEEVLIQYKILSNFVIIKIEDLIRTVQILFRLSFKKYRKKFIFWMKNVGTAHNLFKLI